MYFPKTLIVVCLLASSSILSPVMAQSSESQLMEKVIFYSDITANAALPSTRAVANDSLLHFFNQFLSMPGSFEMSLAGISWISEKVDEESTFKIYTWQLEKEEGRYDYFGYILKSSGEHIVLSDVSNEIQDSEYMLLDAENWYGALYYNITSHMDAEGKPYNILYGIQKVDGFTTRKVAEVISFESDQLVLGKEIFMHSDERSKSDIKSRILLNYSSDANVTLNFHEGLGLIFFENLIPRMGTRPGQGPTWVPDGSYRGYKPEKGYWIYIDKVYDLISETPPRPQPVLDGGGKRKNIFGQDRNG